MFVTVRSVQLNLEHRDTVLLWSELCVRIYNPCWLLINCIEFAGLSV